MNAYDMLAEVRASIAEDTAAHWTDAELLRKLNIKQSKVATILSMSGGNWLTVSKDITPVASKITLPNDCAKVLYLEETSNGYPIHINTTVMDRRVTRLTGVTVPWQGYYDAYLVRDGIMVNVDSFTTQVTLWYQKRVPDLHTGIADTGTGAAVLILSDEDGADASGYGARTEDDYYNDVQVECISGTGAGKIDTITDYTGLTRSAVVTETYAAADVYGTVSMLPEEANGLIALETIVSAIAKPGSSISDKAIEYYMNELRLSWSQFKRWASGRKIGSGHTRVTELIL